MNKDKQLKIQTRITCAKAHFTRLVSSMHNAESIMARAEETVLMPAQKHTLTLLRADMIREFRGMAHELGMASELKTLTDL
jgi:hypothetical protein